MALYAATIQTLRNKGLTISSALDNRKGVVREKET